jgi:hypothetical protein
LPGLRIFAGGGYYGSRNVNVFNALLISGVNATLNVLDVARNDYLLAYRLVVLLAHVGSGCLVYVILLRCSRRLVLSCFFAFLYILTPGCASLLLVAEDNVVSSSMNLAFLLVYLAYVSPASNVTKRLTAVLFPLFLFLSVISHRQQLVLWITPLFLPFFLKRMPRARVVGSIAIAYAGSFACFFLLHAALTVRWLGVWTWSGYLSVLKNMLLPSEFYTPYYFFNDFGWDLPRQGEMILRGLGQILYPIPSWAALMFFLYIGYVAFAMAVLRFRKDVFDRDVCITLLFLLVHVPHSLVFESHSLERWHVIIGPGVVCLGLLAHKVIKAQKDKTLAGKKAVFVALACFGVVAVSFDIGGYVHAMRTMHEFAGHPSVVELAPELRKNVDPGSPHRRRVFVMALDRNRIDTFNATYMYVEAYYDYQDRLFAISEDGSVYRSTDVYPRLVRVPREEFLRAIADAEVVASNEAAALVGRVIGR